MDTQGDSFFVAFPRATDAVAAAAAVQEALSGGSLRARIGVHTGEPLVTGEGYVGVDVHHAARIMAAAHGGQVLVSGTTRRLLDSGPDLRDLGEHRLKDLSTPQRLYQLGDGRFPPPRTLYRTNLPVQATPLVGRERELLEAELRAARTRGAGPLRAARGLPGQLLARGGEAVCGADLDVLESLVVKSLVRRWSSGRLGMLDTIREYALGRLDAWPEAETIRRRHAEFFLGRRGTSLVRQLSGHRGRGRGRCAALRAGPRPLRAARRRARPSGTLAELAALELHGERVDDAQSRAREALELADALRDRPARVFAIGLLAVVAAERGDLERSGRLWGGIEAADAVARLGGWRRQRSSCEERILALGGPELEAARARASGPSLCSLSADAAPHRISRNGTSSSPYVLAARSSRVTRRALASAAVRPTRAS